MARRRRHSDSAALLLMFGVAGAVVLAPVVKFAKDNLVVVIAAIMSSWSRPSPRSCCGGPAFDDGKSSRTSAYARYCRSTA